MSKGSTSGDVHSAALSALLDTDDHADYERRRSALLACNALLEAIDTARQQAHLNKRQLADEAGIEPSSVRRLLSKEAANPTAESAFRLLTAAGVKLEAILPSGNRVPIL